MRWLSGVALVVAGTAVAAVSPAAAAPAPSITCVSTVLPQRQQSLVIAGRNLGVHRPYTNLSIPYIAITNLTRGWDAGRKTADGTDHDLVTLSVARWTSSRIHVTGFAGYYGRPGFVVAAGDRIRVRVWSASTGSGPATFVVRAGVRRSC